MATALGSIDLASLKNLRDDVTQYFWFESNSSSAWGSGAHVTLYPESQFTNPSHANYMKGQNIIMNTDGFSIRNGALPMMVLNNDSLDFNAVDTTQGTYTTMASFGLTGATIGQASGAHSVIDADGQRFYASDGTTQLANIGYGEGQSQGGTSIAPYYTFGVRKITTVAYNSSLTYVVGDMCVYDGKVYVCAYDITTPESWNADHWRYYIGNYSVAEGSQTTASDIYSHAEGRSTIASGQGAHAEGIATLASSYATHAEGDGTSAVGFFSHSEGEDSYASGRSAHAQNMGTIAQRQSQTAIGEYNIADIGGTSETTRGDYVVIIGNGTSELARSNALTVDWNGNVKAAGDYITRQTTLNLGNYVGAAILSGNAGDLRFSIPTGRVFPSGTTISKITFYIVSRASNSNGLGYYIIKSASGGSDGAAFDSSASTTFYNANNASKTITTSMWRKYLDGGTNIRIMFVGGNDFFSGTTTIRNYINNNAATVYVYNIVVTLNIPSA